MENFLTEKFSLFSFIIVGKMFEFYSWQNIPINLKHKSFLKSYVIKMKCQMFLDEIQLGLKEI